MLARCSTRLSLLVTTVAFAVVAPGLYAQNRVFTFYGRSPSDGLGVSTGAGDVNNDGHDDIIVGRWSEVPGTKTGRATVLSGVDGSTLYTFFGKQPNDAFGQSLAGAGDVNQDGYDDVIVGAFRADSLSGSAQVFSGKDGSTLHSFYGDSGLDQFGSAVAGAGDVNQDGYDDVIVGAWGNDSRGPESGSAQVFSGADGSILYTFSGSSAGDSLGISVAGAGDVNNDGYDDLVVGAHLDDDGGTDSGSARVLSGSDGSVLYTFSGSSAGDSFGISVAGAGDVNNDGYDDLVVGAHLDDDGGTDSGSARVLSGLDGSVLYTFSGSSPYILFGSSVAGAGDVNNDGYDDLVVGAPGDRYPGNTNPGTAHVFSGFDGSTIHIFNGDSARDYFGAWVSGLGDVNKDGHADIVVSATFDTNNGKAWGSVRVISGKALSLWSDTHELSWQGQGTQNLTIDAGAQHAGRRYWVFGSVTGTQPGTPFGGVTIPLNLDSWTLVELSYLNTPTFTNFRGQLDGSGRATASINLPPLPPSALGFTMHHAYVVHNANFVPFMASNAVSLHIR